LMWPACPSPLIVKSSTIFFINEVGNVILTIHNYFKTLKIEDNQLLQNVATYLWNYKHSYSRN
jgi:hypothetical protein